VRSCQTRSLRRRLPAVAVSTAASAFSLPLLVLFVALPTALLTAAATACAVCGYKEWSSRGQRAAHERLPLTDDVDAEPHARAVPRGAGAQGTGQRPAARPSDRLPAGIASRSQRHAAVEPSGDHRERKASRARVNDARFGAVCSRVELCAVEVKKKREGKGDGHEEQGLCAAQLGMVVRKGCRSALGGYQTASCTSSSYSSPSLHSGEAREGEE